jgi:phage-related baseplate assembly protein
MSIQPTLIDTTPEAELTSVLTQFEQITGKTLKPAQPEYLIAAGLAYNQYLLIQRLNAAAVNMLAGYATAPMLDYIVALVGVTRTAAQPATCTLQFNLVEGHAALTLPAGTRVSGTDGQVVFETDEDTTANAGVNTIQVSATCQTDGTDGNDYAVGTITSIMDAQAYLSSAGNIDVTAGGADAESDAALQMRSVKASSTFSVAGSKEAYEYYAKSVSSLIVDVAVITTTEDSNVPPGKVEVYALLKNGCVPNEALNSLIESTLSDEKIRPLTDTVCVKSPTAVHYTLTVSFTRLTDYSGTGSGIQTTLEALLENYKTNHYARLGLDVVNSELVTLCKITGVYDLTVTIIPVTQGYTLTGNNLVIAGNEFGYMDRYTVSLNGTNNG